MEHQSLYVLAYVPDAPSKFIDNENLFQLFLQLCWYAVQTGCGIGHACGYALHQVQFLVWYLLVQTVL